jgi:hypothetical protein
LKGERQLRLTQQAEHPVERVVDLPGQQALVVEALGFVPIPRARHVDRGAQVGEASPERVQERVETVAVGL